MQRATSLPARSTRRAFQSMTTQLATDMASSSTAAPWVTASPWRHQ
ncbi:hypothetical protein [Acidovorax sp. 1608163]|nr:hypothetical protein [Acidovorax sp. 1608163]